MPQKVAENNGIVYVAETDGELVGAVVGIIPEQTKEALPEPVPFKSGEVLELVVKTEYRDRGVGALLMNKLEEHLDNNCDFSGVLVFVPNKNAHRLYDKLGDQDRTVCVAKKLQDP